jgi:hypothetical protein
MGLLVRNKNGEFRIFDDSLKYQLRPLKLPITKGDLTKPYTDPYGKIHFEQIPTGEFEEFWGCPIENGMFDDYNRGIKINADSISEKLLAMDYESDPVLV